MNSNSYYHATTAKKWKQIVTEGLKPFGCSECQNGRGVHLCTDISKAKQWVGIFRDERDLYYDEFVIVEVQIDEEIEIVEDEMAGSSYYPDGYVACTEDPICVENLVLVDVV